MRRRSKERFVKLAQIIPPLSVVRLVRADARTPQWKIQLGRSFRIGYYSRQDGTDCVWLVNDAGEYEQTVDQKKLHAHFEVVERSKERSVYGTARPPIPPLAAGGGDRKSSARGSNGTLKIPSKTGHHVVV